METKEIQIGKKTLFLEVYPTPIVAPPATNVTVLDMKELQQLFWYKSQYEALSKEAELFKLHVIQLAEKLVMTETDAVKAAKIYSRFKTMNLGHKLLVLPLAELKDLRGKHEETISEI